MSPEIEADKYEAAEATVNSLLRYISRAAAAYWAGTGRAPNSVYVSPYLEGVLRGAIGGSAVNLTLSFSQSLANAGLVPENSDGIQVQLVIRQAQNAQSYWGFLCVVCEVPA